MEKRVLRVLMVAIIPLLFLAGAGNVEPSLAWGPNTHVVITKQALNLAGNSSLIVQQIQAHPDAFWCGLLFPDISVLYYYTKFESYQATHNWLFYRRLLEEASTVEERVFAYGVAVHLIQDSVAHNIYVPMKIRQTLGSNFYTHPLIEAAVENRYFDVTTSGALEQVDRFLPLANKVLGRDVADMAYTFRQIIRAGAFYSEAYKPPDVPFWDLYGQAAGFIAGLYGVEDHGDYLKTAIELTVRFLQRGETPVLDPTGVEELTRATNTSNTYRFLFTVTVAIIVLAIFKWRKRLKR